MRKLHFILFSLCLATTCAVADEIKVGNATRSMIVHAPAGIATGRPLVISLHGMNQSASYQQSNTHWDAVADTAKFVVVYPSSVGTTWDISGTSDLNFIQAIITHMNERYGIDLNRVYLSGFSMGGMMTYHAMNNIADQIAAFGPVSGYMSTDTKSSRPVPLLHVHGTNDDVVPYGPGNSGATGAWFPGALSIVEGWAQHNQCQLTPATTTPYPEGKNNTNSKQMFSDCDNGVEVGLISIIGKGHWHSDDPAGVYTTTELWNFFKQFTLDNTPPPPPITIPQGPYGENPAVIPGTIEFENYDVGGNGVAYFDDTPGSETGVNWRTDEDVDIEECLDEGGGYNIGWATTGEWWEYTVNVTQAGSYTVEIRVATAEEDRTIALQINDQIIDSEILIPHTGDWQNWQSITLQDVELKSGEQVIRVSVGAKSYLNLNKMVFTLNNTVDPPLSTILQDKKALRANPTTPLYKLNGQRVMP